MDDASLILGSPRGRFFCASVAFACSVDDRNDAFMYRGATVEDVRDVIAAVDVDTVSALTERQLLKTFSLTTDMARYWQPVDDEEVVFARSEVVAVIRPIAVAVLVSPHARWWGGPVDCANQRSLYDPQATDTGADGILIDGSDPLGLTGWRTHALETEDRFRVEFAGRNVSNEWWSTPNPSRAMSTSRALDGVGLGALELVLEEDSDRESDTRVWPVRVRADARVYEIGGPDDWARLVDTYPLTVPESKRSDWFEATGEYRRWFVPDWVAVAQDYDGVHLSLIGYLSTPGVAIPLPRNDGATVLAGWDPDATWWLRDDAFSVDEKPAVWRRDGPWWSPAHPDEIQL